ncbi:MAG: pyrroline-5-carboxylate reductase [Chloroflexi bacterium]|nr:pyrroline-5-carboxylate reductase [Chloroflexota bacterium]
MRIAFIGGGVMAEAMVTGVLEKKLAAPAEIAVGEPIAERRAYLSQTHGVATSESNVQATSGAEIVVLSIKPQSLSPVLQELRGALRPAQEVLSIVAGAKLGRIVQELNHRVVVRVMPNAPGQVGAGMSVWTATPQVSREQLGATRGVLQAVGQETYVTDEKYLDMATAVSGSGPAFVMTFLEALTNAGVHIGLPRDMARTLALQTLLGSAQWAQQTGKHPAELSDMVASPGGTTVEGLLALEEGGFRAAVVNAVLAAFEKSEALS